MKFTKAIVLAGTLPSFLHAGEVVPIDSAPAASRWSFGMSFAPLLNVEADFSGLGGFASPFSLQPLGPGVDREYDDGYVFVDDSGNAGGVTSFWGYDDADQYDPSGSGAINQHITNSASNGRAGATEDFSPAIDLFAYYDMGKVLEISGRPVTWGFRGGLHYSSISVSSSGSLTSDIVRVTDRYDLNGGFPPSAGHAGTSDGFGYLFLTDEPSRSADVIANGATVNGSRSIEADIVTFGFGPYLQIPVSERFSVSLEAGANVAIAHGVYEFDSTTTITDLGTQTSSGDESRTVILPGIYAGFSAMWKLSDTFGLQASARYQYLDQLSVNAGGSEAALSFDGAAVLSIGGVWSF